MVLLQLLVPRSLVPGGRTQTAGAGGADSDVVVNQAGIVVAAFCFLIVLAAIGWGIPIYKIGHPPAVPVTAGRGATRARGYLTGDKNMALPPVLSWIVGWLRAGYPDGVPSVDYIPLFALLAGGLDDLFRRIRDHHQNAHSWRTPTDAAPGF